MIETLSVVLPIIIYCILFILLIICIILGIKLINLADKVNSLVDDIEDKISSIDRIFNVVDDLSDSLNSLGVRFIIKMIKKVIGANRKGNEDWENENS